MTARFNAVTAEVPEDEEEQSRPDAFEALVARLSQQSVTKHFDAYADVPWDEEAYRIEPEDPRWELPADDPLGATEWYQCLAQPTRARLGLEMVASKMKIGLEFESVLKRGLLEYATTLPNRSPEFRYAYHEVIEEAQHSLMFQEFVNRSGYRLPGPRAGRPVRCPLHRQPGPALPAAVLHLRARRRGSDRLRTASRSCAAVASSIPSSSASCAST